MVRRDTRTLGLNAENRAFDYLKREGLEPVQRNFRCRLGEIDLVMHDGDCLVFVEVRYRKRNRFASAAMSIDRHKQRRLGMAAAAFLAASSRYQGCKTRFDVVAFDSTASDRCRLQWLKDAFRPET